MRVSRTVALAALTLGLAAPAARAETATFAYTGAEQSFTVPGGVHSIHVVLVGASGGSAAQGKAGGFGANIAADLPVTPQTTLYVEVGGTGSSYPSPGNISAFNGGGRAGPLSGGGGGATDLRTAPGSQDGTLASRLIVAAGGGGGGEFSAAGASAGQSAAPPGGAAGTATAGGAGCCGGNTNGSLGQGGAGANAGSQGDGGGGGGGGLYGGGGGGAEVDTGYPGGGGSNFTGNAINVSSTIDSTGTPKVTVSYEPAPERQVTPDALTFDPEALRATATRPVTVSNAGSAPMSVGDVAVSGANASEFHLDNGCPAELAPGASCQLTIAFTPTKTGPRGALLTIATSDQGTPAAVQLLGLGGIAPVLTGLHLSSKRFSAASKGGSVQAAAKRGTTVSYELDRAAITTFTVARTKRGIRKGGKCVARPHKPPRKAKPCTRRANVGSFDVPGSVGTGQFVFTGRVGGKTLKHGSYELRAVPKANGHSGKAATAKFKITG